MLLAVALVLSAPNAAPLAYEEVTLGGTNFLKVVTRASEFPTSDKFDASLAVDPRGNVGIAWQSRRQLNGHSGVYFREFSADGLSKGPESRAGSVAGFHESKPSIVFGDRFVTVHESAWRDDSGSGVFAGKASITMTTARKNITTANALSITTRGLCTGEAPTISAQYQSTQP